MTDLATRLRRLADVLQRVHGVKRSVAYRLIGERVGITSAQHVFRVATAFYRPSDGWAAYLDALTVMESDYRLPLRALRAYESACRRRAA